MHPRSVISIRGKKMNVIVFHPKEGNAMATRKATITVDPSLAIVYSAAPKT